MLDIVITEVYHDRIPVSENPAEFQDGVLNVNVTVVNTDMTIDELRQALTDHVIFRMERTLKVEVASA